MSTDSRPGYSTDRLHTALRESGTGGAAARAADALRLLGAWITDADLDEEALDDAARALESLAERLGAVPPASRYPTGTHHARVITSHPILGAANPLAPPLTVTREGDRAVGRAIYGALYEGAPGRVHGGHVAAAFDVTLGYAAALTGQVGLTGTLTVRYRAATPTNSALRYEAWCDRTEGRKAFLVGTLTTPEGTVTAEAEAVYISVDDSHFTAAP